MRVITEGGEVSADAGQLHIQGASSATVLIAAATSFRRYDDVSGDPTALTLETLNKVEGKSFEAMREAHTADHQRLFRRVAIDLGRNAAAEALPTDARVRQSPQVDDPSLAALYFQYGRYLLISSSRPGTQPANLQGLWNDSLNPPWGSKYTININTEMNYWPAEITNLAECAEPLFAMIRDLSETGARFAREHYGASGWVTHHNTDLWRASGPIDAAFYGMWPCGGAWLSLHLWEHYRFNQDHQFLGQAYPLMRGAAEFFLATMVEHPEHGWLARSTGPQGSGILRSMVEADALVVVTPWNEFKQLDMERVQRRAGARGLEHGDRRDSHSAQGNVRAHPEHGPLVLDVAASQLAFEQRVDPDDAVGCGCTGEPKPRPDAPAVVRGIPDVVGATEQGDEPLADGAVQLGADPGAGTPSSPTSTQGARS